MRDAHQKPSGTGLTSPIKIKAKKKNLREEGSVEGLENKLTLRGTKQEHAENFPFCGLPSGPSAGRLSGPGLA